MRYTVNVHWQKKPDEIFTDNKYHRAYNCKFDGGAVVPMSSSAQVVPLPLSDEKGVDPEEAFVAALSGCHMLFFLSIAASQKYTIESYEDNAEGLMSKNDEGKMAMTVVNLKPIIKFSGNVPSAEQVNKIHEEAHEECYIANSVKTKVNVISY